MGCRLDKGTLSFAKATRLRQTDDDLEAALEQVRLIAADLGGTERASAAPDA